MVILIILSRTIYIIYDDTLYFIESLCNKFNVYMILLSFLSKFVLNTKYYKHHIIGHVIFTIFALIIDYYSIFNYIKNKNNDEPQYNFNLSHIVISCLDIIFDCVIFTYSKYLIDVKYISPYIVSFLFGTVLVFYFLILALFKYINNCFLAFDRQCFDLISAINNTNSILITIISLVFETIYMFFYYKIMYYFTPIHILFIFYINIMIENIIKASERNTNTFEWIILIISILFSIIGLSIYLELIELNFCNLNEYTKRNISKRGIEQQKSNELIKLKESKDDEDDENNKKNIVEVSPGYIIKI